ncbi:MAG: hypothetical protein IPH64_20040 [Comamonadaceae bacterium]|nr:hypothetical protein [Comamonadaceae bacterium]
MVSGALQPRLETGSAFLAVDNERISQGAVNATLFWTVWTTCISAVRVAFGASLFSSNTALGADSSYNRWSIDGTAAYSVGDHTFNVAFKAGGKLGGKELPAYSWFQWGGFLQQSGYKTGQLYGNSMTYGRLCTTTACCAARCSTVLYGGVSSRNGEIRRPPAARRTQRRADLGQSVHRGRYPHRTRLSGLRARSGRQPELLLLPRQGVLTEPARRETFAGKKTGCVMHPVLSGAAKAAVAI